MSVLVTYYEKITAEVFNKLSIDLHKFILQEKLIQDYQSRSDEFEKMMILYLDVINNMKKTKLFEDKNDKSNNNISGKAIGLGIGSPTKTNSNENNKNELSSLKSELILYKSYIDNLKMENHKLSQENNNINEAISTYTETSSNINKLEIGNLKTSLKILEEFYEEEIIKKNEIITKLSDFSNEILFKLKDDDIPKHTSDYESKLNHILIR